MKWANSANCGLHSHHVEKKHEYSAGFVSHDFRLGFLFFGGQCWIGEKGGHFSIFPIRRLWILHRDYLEIPIIHADSIKLFGGSLCRSLTLHRDSRTLMRYYNPLDAEFGNWVSFWFTCTGKISCQPVTWREGNNPVDSLGARENHIRLGIDLRVEVDQQWRRELYSKSKPFALIKRSIWILTYGDHLKAAVETTAGALLHCARGPIGQEWVNPPVFQAFIRNSSWRSALILKIHQYEDYRGNYRLASTSFTSWNLLREVPGTGDLSILLDSRYLLTRLLADSQ